MCVCVCVCARARACACIVPVLFNVAFNVESEFKTHLLTALSGSSGTEEL